LWALKSGRLKNHTYVRTFRSTEFEVIAKKRRQVNADGEIIAYTPAKFRIHPRAITSSRPPSPPPSKVPSRRARNTGGVKDGSSAPRFTTESASVHS
jgi:hypothetical protein